MSRLGQGILRRFPVDGIAAGLRALVQRSSTARAVDAGRILERPARRALTIGGGAGAYETTGNTGGRSSTP